MVYFMSIWFNFKLISFILNHCQIYRNLPLLAVYGLKSYEKVRKNRLFSIYENNRFLVREAGLEPALNLSRGLILRHS